MTSHDGAPRRGKVQGDLFHGRVPDGAIYIGRAAPGLAASKYANPFKVKVYGAEAAVEMYRQHLDAHPELVEAARQIWPTATRRAVPGTSRRRAGPLSWPATARCVAAPRVTS